MHGQRGLLPLLLWMSSYGSRIKGAALGGARLGTLGGWIISPSKSHQRPKSWWEHDEEHHIQWLFQWLFNGYNSI